MAHDTDILIAGGGLNGTTLALALASNGLRVTLVGSMPRQTALADDFDGRGYALALASQRLLSALGLWPTLSEHAQPILGIKVSDGRAGEGASPLTLEFEHGELDEGPMGYMIEDRHLRRAIDAAIAEIGIDYIEATEITGHEVTPSGITAKLSDGRSLTAPLLIGCDGKASPTAKRAGISRIGWSYDQTALVCAIAHEEPHHGIAHQFFMPSGPLALLPLTGNRASIVWTETTAEAARINALDDEAYLAELRPRFGSFLGQITLAGARFTYPLGLSLAERFVTDRIALVGDAAHAVHPIAGQGLNAGLRDVAALAEVLIDARRRGEDIGQLNVLERYQQWRRFDVTTLALATDGFNRLFSNDNPALRLARDLGLAMVSRLAPLRRGFMREAAGLTGELPRLSRGLPL